MQRMDLRTLKVDKGRPVRLLCNSRQGMCVVWNRIVTVNMERGLFMADHG